MNDEFSLKKIRKELYDFWLGRCTGEKEDKITFEEVLEVLKLSNQD